jgi:precorrin-6B methylase 2
MEIIKMRLGNNLAGLIDFVNFIKRFYDTKELTLLEIGSFTGESSEIFAQNFKKVTCIDSWVGKSVEMFLKTCTAQDIENKFDEMAAKYDNIQKIKADSIEAASKIKKKFDIVYIDGDHTYNAVKSDIASWIDKAKLIISGHDYNKNHVGVIKAVNQAFQKPDEIFRDSSWLIWKDIFVKMRNKWDVEKTPFNHTSNSDVKKDIYRELIKGYDFKDKTIIDFGCGAGFLGKEIFENFEVKKYIGIDVSKTSIQNASANLEKYDNKELILLEEWTNFSKHQADIFISIFCIRYFSNHEFLETFLKLVNDSGCKELILQYRLNKKNSLQFIAEGMTTFVCYLPNNYIDKYLTNYKKIRETISTGIIEKTTYWSIK